MGRGGAVPGAWSRGGFVAVEDYGGTAGTAFKQRRAGLNAALFCVGSGGDDSIFRLSGQPLRQQDCLGSEQRSVLLRGDSARFGV